MKRKFLSLLLTLAMLCTLLVVPAAAADAEGNWYDQAMSTWVDRGVLKGDENGNLNPTANITRAEMAVMMDRIMGYQVKAANSFTDVDTSAWYADAILKANAAGVLKGDGATVRPNDTMTRQEAMVMLARVLKLSGEAGATAGFTDEAQIASWAVDAVKSMAAKGYVQGSNGMINPTASITRAEMATMLSNIFTGYFSKAGSYDENVMSSAVINTGDVTLSNMKITGDLIVAEGVGAGHIVLDGVTVSGKLIVRGGGENSIVIKGNSNIGDVVIARQDGKVRVSVEGKAKVTAVLVDDGSDAVKIEGSVDTVTLAGSAVNVEVTGTVKTVTIADTADGATLDVAKNAKVDTVTVASDKATVDVSGAVSAVKVSADASKTTITAQSGAKVESVTTAGSGTTIDGKGAVNKVEAASGATDTTVQTPGTKVVNNSSEKVTAGDKTIQSGSTGTATGTTPSGGGSGGSSDTGSKNKSADVIAAKLHDTRADVAGAQSGSYVADDQIAQSYSVSGTYRKGSPESVNVTVKASHLMQHQAGSDAGLGYWAGVGVPQETGNVYAVGWGAYDSANKTFKDAPDSAMAVSGQTYDTFYFNAANAEQHKDQGYIAVKNGETVTVYNITFDVALAPALDNMELWVVTDEESYNKLPKAYTDAYAWDASYADASNPIHLPWLAVKYDSNTASDFTMTLTKDNQAVTVSNNTLSGTNSINADRYQSWHMTTQDGDWSSKDYLTQTDPYGTYTLTIQKDDQTFTKTITYKDPAASYYDITFQDGANATTTPFKAGAVITPPAEPSKTGYTFKGWYLGETKLTDQTTATENATYTAKWEANTYLLTYDSQNETENTTKNVVFGDAYGELPTVSKDGYTLKGWFTEATGGTQVTAETKMTTENATIYAQWTAEKVTTADQLKAQLADTSLDTVTLANNVSIFAGDLSNAWRERTVVLDLNGQTLTITKQGETETTVFVGPSVSGSNTVTGDNNCATTDITIRNGKVEAQNAEGTVANFSVETGHKLTFEGTTTKLSAHGSGSAILVRGNGTTLNVKNSDITADGVYVVSTNANNQVNYGVKINIDGSTLTTKAANGDDCPLMINVPGTVNVTNSEITGQRMGMLVRSGDVTVKNTKITATIGKYYDKGILNYYTTANWKDGNEAPWGAVVVGKNDTKQGNTYTGDIKLTLTGCTLSCTLLTDANDNVTDKYCSALYAQKLDTANDDVSVVMEDCTVQDGNVVDRSDVLTGYTGEVLNNLPSETPETPTETTESNAATEASTPTDEIPTENDEI